MLVAHASSTCDVCLESYHEDCSYHSIPCGHVFCLPCLVSTSPPRCPLCRHDFTAHSMRKIHLTLPSERDMAARKFELKLVQSSPEMSLSDSLVLFQEVQEWMDGAAEDEFLVLRAFAAVLCSFHETKDKLLQMETLAEKKEADYSRSLDEARSAANVDATNHKTKYDAATSEIAVLRAECAYLRSQAENAQQRNAEIQAYHVQEVNALLAQLHTSQIAADFMPESSSPRRVSNPLPTPPRPIDIPYLKLSDEKRKASSPSRRADTGRIPRSVATAAATTDKNDFDADPLTSAFVPTLSTSFTTTRRTSTTTKSRSEVTTLVFRPPKRMPAMWDTRTPSRSSRTVDISEPSQHHSDGSSRREVRITEDPKRNVESVSQTRSDHTTDEDPQAPQLPSNANVPPRSTDSTPPTRVVVQYTNNDSDGASSASSANIPLFQSRRNSMSRDLSAVEGNNRRFTSKPPTSSTLHDILSAPEGTSHTNQDSFVDDASSTLAVARINPEEGRTQRGISMPSRFSGSRRAPSPVVRHHSDSGSADSRMISDREVDSLPSDFQGDRERRVSTLPTRKPRHRNEGKVGDDLSNLIQNHGRRGLASSKPAQRRPETATPRTGESSYYEHKNAAQPRVHQAIRVIRYDPTPSSREIPVEQEPRPLHYRVHNNNSGSPWSSHGNLRLVASVHSRDGAAPETSSVPSRERAYAHSHSYSYPGPPASLRASRHTDISTFHPDNHITSDWHTAVDSRANAGEVVFISP